MPTNQNNDKEQFISQHAYNLAMSLAVVGNATIRQYAQRAAYLSHHKEAPKSAIPPKIDPASFNQFLRGTAGRIIYGCALIVGVSKTVDHLTKDDYSPKFAIPLKAVLETIPGTPIEIFNTAHVRNITRSSLVTMPLFLARNTLNWSGIEGVLSDEKGDLNSYRDFYYKAKDVFSEISKNNHSTHEDPTKSATYILSKKVVEGVFMGIASTPFHNLALNALSTVQSQSESTTIPDIYANVLKNLDRKTIFAATDKRIFACVVGAILFSKQFQELTASKIEMLGNIVGNTLFDKEEIKENTQEILDKSHNDIKDLVERPLINDIANKEDEKPNSKVEPKTSSKVISDSKEKGGKY